MRHKLFKSVLLIDDNEIDNRVNKIIIQSCDFAYSIHIVKSASGGIHFLEGGCKTSTEIPDLIFLDIKMPEVDGFGFLSLFAQLSEAIRDKCKIIMLTSSIDIIDYNRAISNPYVCNYLKKPLNTLELLALVKNG